MRLDEKVAIITGAATGVGVEIAKTFAREGAKVIITDSDEITAETAAEDIANKGGNALGVALDVTNEDQVNEFVASIAKKYGQIDVLVCNANDQHIEPVNELSYENWRRIIALHLDGAFLMTRACLKYMYEQNSGSIIYMGSVHSKIASKLKAPFVSAKHALLGLCRTVAKEGAEHNVRANVICPGFVKTPFVEKQIPEHARELGLSADDVISKVMLGQTIDNEFTSMQDVADIALLFASFETGALSGQSLLVSHGWVME